MNDARPLVRRLARLGLLLLGAAPCFAQVSDPLVARGREIYVREGCVNCHSQYVRPHVPADVERWGPASDLATLVHEKPPLFGNRRLGPDLANVGNRRSAEWNRLHLRSPRAVSPGSRMPSYAHLFDGSDASDGEALIAYLASLGAETIPSRLAQIAAWRPAPATVPAAPARAQRIFAQLCTPCHGPAGRGDGPLAVRLSVRPPDWSTEGWRRVPPSADVELALARLIKFGLPGSPMAGHEALSDSDALGLARVVRTWQKR